MSRQVFTLDEARQALPQVREWAEQMVQLSREVESFVPAIRDLENAVSKNAGSPEGTLYLDRLLKLRGCLMKMEEIGVLVKSAQEGLVDFPCLKEGREVYLCWKYGEEDIEYWHEVDAGFAGRTPIDEL